MLSDLEIVINDDFQFDGVSLINGGKDFNFINAAYTLCYLLAFDELKTGNYCLRGNLVSTMPGKALMAVVEETFRWAVKNGLMYPEKIEEDLKWLRNEIRHLG